MATARHYYKIVCENEASMEGAGLGYEEMFGNAPRYHWSLNGANAYMEQMNAERSEDDGTGAYSVEKRAVYADGSWDDEGDDYASEQLGPIEED